MGVHGEVWHLVCQGGLLVRARVRFGARVRVRVGARVGVRVRDRDRVRVRVRVSRLVGEVRAHPWKLDAGGDAWFTLGLGCGVGVGVGVEVGP